MIYKIGNSFDIERIIDLLKQDRISLTNDMVLQLLEQLDDDKIELQERIENLEAQIDELI
jgi:hypothetical protein